MYPEIYKAMAVKNRMTTADLSRKSGIPKRTLTNKLGGRSDFKLSEMRMIQKVLGVRYNTPMTQQQAKCLNAAIRTRARELLAERKAENEAVAVRRLGNAIRRAVLTRYGAGLFTEIPKDQYPVALTQVQTWPCMFLNANRTAEDVGHGARPACVEL